MFTGADGFYPASASVGSNGRANHSFSASGNSLRHLDQGGYTLPLAGGFAFGDHVQNPYNQESLESLFSSLSVSGGRNGRGLNGFALDDNLGGGGGVGGGFVAGDGVNFNNHLASSNGGWLQNCGVYDADDQGCARLFNPPAAARHNFQSNAAAVNPAVLRSLEFRDYLRSQILYGSSEPGFWDGAVYPAAAAYSNPYYNDPITSLNGVSSRFDSSSARTLPKRNSSSSFNNKRPNHHNNHHHNQGSSNGGLNSSSSSRRSDLLQEQSNHTSLENFRGQILSLAQDQHGCRFLQRIIGTKKAEEIEIVFLELVDHVGQLMLDQFGNYVVQKLVEVCTDEQRTQILRRLTRNEFQLLSICLNMYGTRAIQKLLDHVTVPQQVSVIMPALSRGAVALTKDMNGHHVIQHCLKSFSHEDNKYLLNEVADNCLEIATDKSGCCVLQVCVEYSQGETRDRLVSEIISNALHLSQDCYGNYVVQNIVGLKVEKINAALLQQLQGDFVNLSCNKYGSNVVEKCMSETTEEQSTQVMMEMLGSPKASVMLVDPYGNFVVQTALEITQARRQTLVHSALVELVRRNVPMMRSNIYGKKVLAWFGKRQWLHM
ncbi:unnamed protein product [Linum trigynum]|uniref:PUM-HD domain-containing protein n=1 Tax=Linum trigynum TaxID=586398 RepID=A0AAV2GKB7_9ROSI